MDGIATARNDCAPGLEPDVSGIATARNDCAPGLEPGGRWMERQQRGMTVPQVWNPVVDGIVSHCNWVSIFP